MYVTESKKVNGGCSHGKPWLMGIQFEHCIGAEVSVALIAAYENLVDVPLREVL